MAAMLRRRMPPLQPALSRLLSSAPAVSQLHPRVIPAEVAQLVSLRGGMAALPPDVEAAVDQAAAESNRKAVKRRGQELSQRLRHMSRSKHRGGQHPNLSEQLAAVEQEDGGDAAAARRQRRGKRRQNRGAALDLLTRAAALPVSDAWQLPDLRQAWGDLAQVVSAEEQAQAAEERAAAAARTSVADGGSLYDPAAALAYAASRLPACYAALRHALGEVAARRPGWRPATQLDFGAGPGTAVWAAQQVWRQAPLDALAVEPAGAMAWLGHEIQQRQRQQYEASVARAAQRAAEQRGAEQRGARGAAGRPAGRPASPAAAAAAAAAVESEEEGSGEDGELPAPPPRLRWMYKLPPRYRAAQGKQYDLVTAGYVLVELRSDAERRRIVQQLWERTAPGGVLLLVEPGTPAGAATIQQARRQLLQAGAAEQQLAQQALRPGEGAAAAAAAAGSHIVAPCPHDGACPLESRTAWCHFVQRFQRTALQRAAKATSGIQPRTYQDERFSYIAVARGPRPAVHSLPQQPLVAGSFMPSFEDPQDSLQLPAHLAPRKVPGDAQPLTLYSDSEEEEQGGARSDIDGWWDAAGRESGGGSSSSSSSSSGSEDEYSSSDSGSSASSSEYSSSESDSDSSSDSSSSGGSGGEAQQRQLAAAAGAGGSSPQLPAGLDEATRRLLLESVMAGTDDDEEECAAAAELAEQLEQQLLAAEASAAAAAAAAAAAPAGAQPGGGEQQRVVAVLAPVSDRTADLLLDGRQVDWEAEEAEAVAAARAASGAWSRVIRTPRKRSGHVVLDLCSAAPADAGSSSRGGSSGGGGGVLLRQVVSKAAARREAGGTAAYRLARRLRWGDLWPLHYQRSFRAEEAPATAVSQA